MKKYNYTRHVLAKHKEELITAELIAVDVDAPIDDPALKGNQNNLYYQFLLILVI